MDAVYVVDALIIDFHAFQNKIQQQSHQGFIIVGDRVASLDFFPPIKLQINGLSIGFIAYKLYNKITFTGQLVNQNSLKANHSSNSMYLDQSQL